jgi:hypothetical protein
MFRSDLKNASLKWGATKARGRGQEQSFRMDDSPVVTDMRSRLASYYAAWTVNVMPAMP